jgi:hypothetical protein
VTGLGQLGLSTSGRRGGGIAAGGVVISGAEQFGIRVLTPQEFLKEIRELP